MRRAALTLLLIGCVLTALAGQASAARVLVGHVGGSICDFNAEQILFVDSTGLKIEDRATDNVTSVPPVPDRTSYCGFLSPHGAVFEVTGPNVSDTHAYEFRDGALIDLGQLNSQLKVVGAWAIWSNSATLHRRDLEAGTTVTVATNAGNTENDVDESGNVYYWAYPNYQIFRFDGTSTTQLTNDASLWNTYPITDGINVVYRKHTPCCFNEHGSVAFYGAGGETVLDSARDDWPEPRADYDAAGGWIGFTRLGAANELQVWLRSPSGSETRISPTGHGFRMAAMSPTGQVIYFGSGTDYFLASPGSARVDLGTPGGRFFWRDGDWYLVASRSLYRIDPDPNPYPRPKGATPFRASLVTAYQPCSSPNSSHGAPLAFGSCKPPQLASQYLTVGTPDSNGLPPRSVGTLLVRTKVGNLNTWADEADVKLDFSYSDVFKKDLTDYTGELQPTVVIRRSDRNNVHLGSGLVDNVDATQGDVVVTTTTDHGLEDGDRVVVSNSLLDQCTFHDDYESTITVTGARTFILDGSAIFDCTGMASGGGWSQQGTPDPDPATGTNFPFAFSVPCVATADAAIGSDCVATTSADAIAPGLVREGDRAIWQFASVRVFDGGADGDADTVADNTLFATEGIFVP